MSTLLHWLAEYGLAVAFVNLLVEQLGLPVPAYPILVVTGALSFDGRFSTAGLVAVAVAGCLVADLVWYFAGQRFGRRVLRTVCRLSISPDSCVRQTESLFARWGVWSLLVAKFIPGFGTIATVLAGNNRLPLAAFLAVDTLGSLLYVGGGVALGLLFHNAIDDAVALLAALGHAGLMLMLGALLLFIASKWWQRERLLRELRSTRITVPELQELLKGALVPTIIDVRTADSRQRDGAIPGALPWSLQAGTAGPPDLPRDADVVVYCACPNEVSAAKVARQLQQAGFRRVRPLHGGIDAWIAAGLPLEWPDKPDAPHPAPPLQQA